MTFQFKEAPVQGEVDILPNGRKFQWNAGKWDLYTSTLPQNVTPVISATPPVESATAPALPNANKYWFDTTTNIMHYQHNGAWVALASGSGGSATPVPPLVGSVAPVLPNTNPLWFNPVQGVLYVQKVVGENRSWERCTPEVIVPEFPVIPDVTPIVSESTPALPVSNGFWFKPSTGVLSVQETVNNVTSWVRSIPEVVIPAQVAIPPIQATVAPALPNANPLWFNPTEGVMYVQKTVNSVTSWARVTPEVVIPAPTAVAPLESETPPALPNANPFWFKPSTSVLHYQYNDGNSTQWVEI